MQYSKRNQETDYYLNGQRLKVCEMQRDLGVLMLETQIVSSQLRRQIAFWPLQRSWSSKNRTFFCHCTMYFFSLEGILHTGSTYLK